MTRLEASIIRDGDILALDTREVSLLGANDLSIAPDD